MTKTQLLAAQKSLREHLEQFKGIIAQYPNGKKTYQYEILYGLTGTMLNAVNAMVEVTPDDENTGN